jgi:hypothetical protein
MVVTSPTLDKGVAVTGQRDGKALKCRGRAVYGAAAKKLTGLRGNEWVDLGGVKLRKLLIF